MCVRVVSVASVVDLVVLREGSVARLACVCVFRECCCLFISVGVVYADVSLQCSRKRERVREWTREKKRKAE